MRTGKLITRLDRYMFRQLVFALAAAFIIPIPWALAWYARWYVSQFVLVEPTAYANA